MRVNVLGIVTSSALEGDDTSTAAQPEGVTEVSESASDEI